MMSDEITQKPAQTESTETKPSRYNNSINSSNQVAADNDSSVGKHAETTRLAVENRPTATPDMSLERPPENLVRQNMTERATKPSNPLEMPYDNVSPDSKEYKDWRKVQHRHGMRNLILALVVFGSLAVLYWVYIHQA